MELDQRITQDEIKKVKTTEIRNATAHDLPQLARLFNSYRVFYKKESDIEGAEFFLQERMTRNESVIFVSLDNDRITGFTQLYPLFSSTRMRRLWLLNDLFVDEEFRGQGISVALIDKIKEWCTQSCACGFMLETAKTNSIGNQLYQKTGLELDTEHNVYNWDVK